MKNNEFKDITGYKFGKLTVIEFIGLNKYNNRLWKCQCDCGNFRNIIYSNINKNVFRSCGCDNYSGYHGNRKGSSQYCSWNALINRYKQKARIRKYSWDLSKEDCLRLFSGNCFYCGIEPFQKYSVYITKTNKYRLGNKNWMDSSWVIYNGIDRSDNNLGYTKNNSVSCCKICNYAKNDLEIEEFQVWLKRLRNKN